MAAACRVVDEFVETLDLREPVVERVHEPHCQGASIEYEHAHTGAANGVANGPHYGAGRVEYDVASALIIYEEYHPFGTSAYRAVDSTIEVSPKRYRYAAAERDEETGLDHMGLRYYAPWLGRWTSADPIGLGDGVNRYAYVHGNPVSMRDPGGTRAGGPDDTPSPFANDPIIPYESPQSTVEGPVEAVYEFEDEAVTGEAPDLRQEGSPQQDFPGLPPEMLEGLEPGEVRVQEVDGKLYQVTNTGTTTNVASTNLLPTNLDLLKERTGSEAAAKIVQATFAERNAFIRQQLEQGVPPHIAEARFAARGRENLKVVVGAALALLQGAGVVGGVSAVSPRTTPSSPTPTPKAQETKAAVPEAKGTARGGAQPVRAGQAGERAVRAKFDIGEKVPIRINGRGRIPDGLTDSVLSEVKNVKSLSYTRQLRDFADYAHQTGRRFDLYVRPDTELSGPLLDAIEAGVINRRFIP